MIYTWNLDKNSLPDYLNFESVKKSIQSGANYVTKICKNQVTFEYSEPPYNIGFGFEDFGKSDNSIGNWELIRPGRFAITFNTQYKWGTLYQFWRPMGIRSLVIHELGHILGLGHSDDPHSIMHPKPYLPYFNGHEKAQLLYLTNPNRKKKQQ